MTGITIRPIRETDISGFHACLDAVARERLYLGLLKAQPMDWTRKWLLDGMERGVVRLVAVDGAQVIGWCDIEASSKEGFHHVGRLGMGVLKEYRRRGIGQQLLLDALRAAEQQGLEKVELDVYATNAGAIKLYEKMGFHHEGRKRKARKIDGHYDDVVLMGLFLGDDGGK